jgi:hypothetical protein
VDVHPLDEAQGYAALIQLQPDTYTVESIASRVGRSPAYVSGRLRLIQLIAERVEKLSRVRILEAVRKKLPDALSRPDLEMVALDYFRRLGHDNHPRLSKLYAWEHAQGKGASEKKSKTSWGAQTVDYEKIATAAVQAMKPADLNRFLVVCALVSDLYCPGYNPRQSLEKNSNLDRTAVRCKVDSVKIDTAVRAELSKKTSNNTLKKRTGLKAKAKK